MKPVVDQFVVVRGRYDWMFMKVTVVTAKQFKAVEEGSTWERSLSPEVCTYCGDEASARRLYKGLQASYKKYEKEQDKAYQDRNERDRALIAAAQKKAK